MLSCNVWTINELQYCKNHINLTHLCLRLLLCLYIKAPGLLTGADLEGEEDEGEELSPVRVDEEWMEEVLEEDLGFVAGTTAV